ALPALKAAFDRHPELAARLGDLAGHAEQALLALAAGDNLAAREAIARRVAALRGELSGEGRSPLERLPVQRGPRSLAEGGRRRTRQGCGRGAGRGRSPPELPGTEESGRADHLPCRDAGRSGRTAKGRAASRRGRRLRRDEP